MTLEYPNTLKEKNYNRLRYLKASIFSVGINVTAPSRFKDKLRILSVYLLLASAFTLYGHVHFIRRCWGNISVLTQAICTFLQISISFLKIWYMAVVERRFSKIIHKLETHELVNQFDFLSKESPYNEKLRSEAIKVLDQCWKFATGQFNFYLFACVLICIYYYLLAIGKNIYHTSVGTANYTNVLPFPTIFPFWEDKMNHFPQYLILTVLTISGSMISSSGALSFDGMFIYIALHGVALIKILKKAIALSTCPTIPKDLHLTYLRQCIQQYERTYEYCNEVNDLYLHLTIVQFIFSLISLGVVMFQLAVGLESDYIMFFQMIVFISAAGYEVIIYCLNGQLITSESEGISNAWYACEWYNESTEFKQLIQMIILRSNKDKTMRASWFTTMSLPTLLNIVRNSVSYFLLLRNLTS